MTPNNRNELVALLCRALDSHVGIDHEGAANAVIDTCVKSGVTFVPAMPNDAVDSAMATDGRGVEWQLSASEHMTRRRQYRQAITAGRIDGGGKEGA